jgi:thiol-disulfide isomerase/thioredoxin
MKKRILSILIILISNLTFACDCDEINPIIEFYSSEYVFEGKIISKIYAKDSLTYKVTFDISKHYKNGDFPKTLAFDVAAEEEYTGQGTSCDWSARKNQNWLVYAYKYKGNLTFSGMCSNSKVINNRPIGLREQKMLNNGNSFKIEDYIFEYESGFNYCKNVTDIKPILEKGKIKDYENETTLLIKGNKALTTLLNVFIDKKGNLKSVTRRKELVRKKDSIFNLITEIEDANSKPITEFEIDAIELIKKVKKWEIKQQNQSGITVPYIRHIWVNFDLKTSKWSYDL